jgi:hypothetical protein
MSSTAMVPAGVDFSRLRIPGTGFEVLGYLLAVAAATLALVAEWRTVNAAVVLTVALLVSLIVLSWLHLGQGRHLVPVSLHATLYQAAG